MGEFGLVIVISGFGVSNLVIGLVIVIVEGDFVLVLVG